MAHEAFFSGERLEEAARLSARLGCACLPDVFGVERDEVGVRLFRGVCGGNLVLEYRPRGEDFVATLVGERVDSGERFIIGGRGLGSVKNCERLRLVGRRLGLAVGFTRPVAMNGWCGLDEIVGQSGRRVSTGLCVAVGVSGSSAFMAGLSASRLIAVNTDKDAAIFRYATDGVVVDAGEFLEALLEVSEGRIYDV